MFKNIKKTICVFIAFMIAVSAAGCSRSGSAAKTTAKTVSGAASAKSGKGLDSFSLPYNTVQNFNPLLPTSKSNMALWPLMYDCLSEPDASFNPVMRLASSVTSSGNTVTVKLKSDVKFTDGSALSASDVIYSLNFVRSNTSSPYNSRLSSVTSVDGKGLTVTITLSTPDPLFANMLDIPIIKENSDKTGDAVGTGRFKIKKNGVDAVLERNSGWYNGTASKFSKITLVNIPSNDALMPSLSIGETNFIYSDDGSGTASSAPNTETTQVNINQLVFVGLNTSKPHLNNSHFRRALSYSINRELLASQNYSNRAFASTLPFNPKWAQLQNSEQLSADFNTVASELSAAGETGSVSMTLLVNQENSVRNNVAKFLVSCFSKAGVNLTVKSVSFDEYNSLIQSGNFDMYIGETKLPNNMNISQLLASGGTAAYGAPADSSAFKAFSDWQKGTGDLKSVSGSFDTEMPFLPLCFRTGLTSYTSGLSGVQSLDNDLFFNFEKWN
ncbi:MAG TPA: ABC transporter substrate-binding protein [Ruminiclostridium sp.]|nr:ABC transporter substrate-binding protein [Ruminiclostridium sp.]